MESKWYRKLLNIKVKQRFYPQCVNCSKRQSNILSNASRIVLKLQQEERKSVFFRRLPLTRSSTGSIIRGRSKIPNLAQSGGGTNAYIHGMKLRREHFAGGILAAVTVGESDELDVLNGNRIRFREWQLKVYNALENCLGYLHIDR